MTAGLEEFYNHYTTLNVRHFYEHIFIDTKCRLYFDLEYMREHNPEMEMSDSQARFMEDFLSLLVSLFTEYFEEYLYETNFLVLDSSTEQKFSKHVIVHSKRLFSSNVEMKRFIDVVCSKLKQQKVGIVKDDKGKETLIVDSGVYNKNRCFRMLNSCKYGKSALLVYDNNCYFYGNFSMNTCDFCFRK